MMSLHDQAGGRKYLTREEHARFLLAVDQAPRDVRAFCHSAVPIPPELAIMLDLVFGLCGPPGCRPGSHRGPHGHPIVPG
jgi:hypothetical protein